MEAECGGWGPNEGINNTSFSNSEEGDWCQSSFYNTNQHTVCTAGDRQVSPRPPFPGCTHSYNPRLAMRKLRPGDME